MFTRISQPLQVALRTQVRMDGTEGRDVENPLVLRAHIRELEELRDGLLADAKSGCGLARRLVVRIHRVAMEKRNILRGPRKGT